MRAFGSDLRDLDVDFTAPPPFVVTDLLCRCARMNEEVAWDLPVGVRTEAIFALAARSSPGALSVALRCPGASCREAIEIDFDAAELRESANAGQRRATMSLHGRLVELRRPTGGDQRQWLQQSWHDAATARRAMLATLLMGVTAADLDEAAAGAVERELARMDPLVDFTVTVECPACHASAVHTLAIERHALAVLRNIQERLLATVARLASQFHWTEAEILSLPAWRRDRYLAFGEQAR